MKKQRLIVLMLLLYTLSGCDNNSRKPGKASSTEVAEDATLKGCYLGVLKRDTIQLAITSVKGDTLEGKLLFDFYEKDRAEGTFTGTYSKGVLLADYTFFSEGVRSVRQVLFKRTASGFLEGHGNSTTKGEKEVFIDTSKVRYDHAVMLNRSDVCIP